MTTDATHAPRARAAMERGLATGHGEAYLASAIYKLNRSDPEGAAGDLATALLRAPMSSPTHETTARLLVEVEGLEEARKHFETAIGLDPGRTLVVSGDFARLDALNGDFASSARRLAPLLADPDPSLVQLGSVFEARLAAWRGDKEAMRVASTRFAPRMGSNGGLIHQYITMITRDPDALEGPTWRGFLASFENTDRPSRQQLMGLQLLTEVALTMKRVDSAFDTLEAVADLGLMDVVWLDRCPLLIELFGTKRFKKVHDKVAERAARVLAAFQATH